MDPDALKRYIREALTEAGACAVGFARAEPVPEQELERFRDWTDRGLNGPLEYMRNYPDLRANPQLLLEGAATVVTSAWNYLPSALRDKSLPGVARYAYGRDYHKALRSRIRPVLRQIEALTGTRGRICIDSAPVLERYWAFRSGVALRGRNGCAIVPGKGSWIFLAEILLTVALEPDAPAGQRCLECGACIKACPTGALQPDGRIDAARCLSAATVEGAPLPADYAGEVPLLGCDRCQGVCPHNRGAGPSEWLEPLDLGWLDSLDTLFEEDFLRLSEGTPFRRPGLQLLRRNLSASRRK